MTQPSLLIPVTRLRECRYPGPLAALGLTARGQLVPAGTQPAGNAIHHPPIHTLGTHTGRLASVMAPSPGKTLHSRDQLSPRFVELVALSAHPLHGVTSCARRIKQVCRPIIVPPAREDRQRADRSDWNSRRRGEVPSSTPSKQCCAWI